MRVEDRETTKLFRVSTPLEDGEKTHYYAALDHDLERQVQSKWSFSPNDRTKFRGMVTMILFWVVFMQSERIFIHVFGPPVNKAVDLCPQVASISPSKHVALLDELEHDFLNETYRLAAYESLGGAVRIPCVKFQLHPSFLLTVDTGQRCSIT